MCKRLVFLVVVLGLAAGAARANLVAYWPMNEGAGATVADASGNRHTGTIQGKPTWVDGPEGFGKALYYGGQNPAVGWVNCGTWDPSAGTGQLTVAFWVKYDGPVPGVWQGVVGKRDGSGDVWSIEVTADNHVAQFFTQGSWPYCGQRMLPTGVWTHVAVTFDGATMVFYIDGVETGRGGVSLGPKTDAGISIGCSIQGGGNGFHGAIDEVRLYDNALSAAEVKKISAPFPGATNPNPEDGAVLGTDAATLTWTPGPTAGLHDVYFGTTQDPPFIKRQRWTTYAVTALQPGMTYYWRVDEVDADQKTIYKGLPWSFTVGSLYASSPSPADGAGGLLPFGVLSWQVGNGAQKHHLYFGTDYSAVTARAAGTDKGLLTAPTFSAGDLRSATTYYWLVDEVPSSGPAKQGPVWSFTTENRTVAGKVLREWWTNIPGWTVADLRNDPRFPDHPTGAAYLDAFEGPVNWGDNYGSRLRGWLKPPQSGSYRFWIASQDNSELWLSTDTNPINAVKIAGVNSWTGVYEWGKESGQKSALIPLKEGRKYYIEAVMKGAIWSDHVEVSWQPPDDVQQVIPGSCVDTFILLPVQAWSPSPKNSAVGVNRSQSMLAWSAASQAAEHAVYFGTDKAAVMAATPSTANIFKGQQTSRTFQLPTLETGKTYYWRVDEINTDDPQSPWKGPMWTFTTADFVIVDDFESYSDADGQRIYETWIDGNTNGTCSQVGYSMPPSVERTIVHAGRQSMPFSYNNSDDPWYSETQRTWDTPQDWTGNNIDTLSLWYRCTSVAFLESPPGTIAMSAAGADIWNTSDEFRFAYKRLSGNGSILAQVESVGNTDGWAKAGVMIRESLEADSKFVMAVVTPANGVAFQDRSEEAGNCDNVQASGAAPYWVRVSRTGSTITVSRSADGSFWEKIGDVSSITMPMPNDIYIGLALTSHNSFQTTTAKFSNVATTGGVTGKWQTANIGTASVGNEPAPLYVILQDSAGHIATVHHPEDPYAVLKMDWTQWNIPLSSFTAVNMKAVTSMSIRIGAKVGATPGGRGTLYIDDICVIKPPATTGP
jgi:hypothetical protein